MCLRKCRTHFYRWCSLALARQLSDFPRTGPLSAHVQLPCVRTTYDYHRRYFPSEVFKAMIKHPSAYSAMRLGSARLWIDKPAVPVFSGIGLASPHDVAVSDSLDRTNCALWGMIVSKMEHIYFFFIFIVEKEVRHEYLFSSFDLFKITNSLVRPPTLVETM